jgi:diguanylate cyclase (GGDEF)-like protein
LLQDGQAFGALTLYSKEANALNSEHLRLLEIVMSPLAHAIATAKARQHTRDETLTDAITGLPNHQALQVKADESIQNALRHGKDLTLLLLDLDRFSEINERFGFHVGDQFLHEIGQLMRSCLRPSDFLARTENDAFVAVLPDTSPERAATALAQIESAVAAHCLRVSNGEEIYATISAGYASLCDDGRSLADLLGKAHCRLSNRAVTPFVAGVAAYACGNQVH